MALMRYREANQVLWRGVRPGHNGTQVYGYGLAVNATVVMYTAAGVTSALIHMIGLTAVAGANPGQAWVQLYDAVPAVIGRLAIIELGATTQEAFCYSLDYPVELLEDYSIRVTSSALLLQARGWCLGWSE